MTRERQFTTNLDQIQLLDNIFPTKHILHDVREGKLFRTEGGRIKQICSLDKISALSCYKISSCSMGPLFPI